MEIQTVGEVCHVHKVMVKEEGVVISLNDYNLKIREWENRFITFEFLITLV